MSGKNADKEVKVTKEDSSENMTDERRAFLKRAGAAAAATPAVTMLLSAKAKQAAAGPVGYEDGDSSDSDPA